MPCSTNTNVDENIKKIFYKTRQFVVDALEQGNMSIETGKALAIHFLDRLKHGDPFGEKFMEIALLPLDNKEKEETTISPDEKDFFQELLTKLENRELEI